MSGYNLKTIKQKFKEKGIYYTPEALALYLKSFIDVEYDNVYDPTCGDGGLLAVFDDAVKKYGQEINQEQLDVASNRLINFTGYCGDTLTEPAFMGTKFDLIMANPPYSIKWAPPQLNSIFADDRFRYLPAMPHKSKADYAFLLHILYMLSDAGQAIVLNSPGILYRGNSEGILRKWIIDNNWIEKVVRIPSKTFIDTNIETVVLIFKKNKVNTDIVFIDQENNQEYVAKKEEIIKNDYCLSVNLYIRQEITPKNINPVELHNQARLDFIEKLKKDLIFDKKVCELEGWDFNLYKEQLLKIIGTF